MGSVIDKIPPIQINSNCCKNENSFSYRICKKCGSKINLSKIEYTEVANNAPTNSPNR